MNLNRSEIDILNFIAEKNLATKAEVIQFFKTNGFSGKDTSDFVDTTIYGLVQKGLLCSVTPIGSVCFVVTRKGAGFLSDARGKN